MRKLIWIFLAILCSAHVQAQNIEGQIVASQFGNYQVPGIATGSLAFEPSTCQVSGGGKNFVAFTTGVPVKIVDANPALTEVDTPSSVNITGCSISMATTYIHTTPFYATSGTGGLQEALTNGPNKQGGANTVILNADWYTQVAPSNPATVIAAVKGSTKLGIVDVTTAPYTVYAWNGSAYAVVPYSSGNLPGGTGIVKVTSGVGGLAAAGTDYALPNANTTGTAANLSGTPALPNGVTATTGTVGENDNKLGTNAAIYASKIASIPATLSALCGNNVAGVSIACPAGSPGTLPAGTGLVKVTSSVGGLASPGNDYVTPNASNGMNPLGTATSGGNFASNVFQLQGNYWNGSAGVGDFFNQQSIPAATGANPTMINLFNHTGSGGGALGLWTYPVSFASGFKGPTVSAEFFGAKGDAYAPTDGCITTATSTTVNCPDAPFVSGDVGKQIWVQGGGVAGVAFNATINTVTDSSHVVVSAAASTSVGNTPGNTVYGHDDVTAVQACFQYSASNAVQCVLDSPTGYLIGSGSLQLVPNNTVLETSATNVTGSNHAKGTNLYCEFNGDCITLAAGPIQGAHFDKIALEMDPTQPNSRGLNFTAQAGTYGNGGLFNATLDSVEVDNPSKECLYSQGGGGPGYAFNLPNQYVTFLQFNCNLANRSRTAQAIKMVGQHAQIIFEGGAVNGPSTITNDPNALVYIGELTGGLSDSPTDVKFYGYTIETGTIAMQIGEGALNIHYDNSYIENIPQPFISVAASGLTFNGNHIANSGNVNGVFNFSGGVTAGIRDNYVYGTANPDATLATCSNNTNTLDFAGNVAGSSNTLTTAGCATAQVVPTTSTYTSTGGTTNFVNGSAVAITTITAPQISTGKTLTLYAGSAPGITLATGGNINLGGYPTPLVIPANASVTLTLFDLGPSWVVTSVTPVPASTSTVTATGSATPRSLGVRAADVFNVRDYGALGTNTSTAIGTTFGSSLSALAAYTTPAGATPFSWATNPLFGLTFSMVTSAAQGSTSNPLTFLETITHGWSASVALWQDPANGNYLVEPGMNVTGSCIAANTTVSSIDRTAGDTNYGKVTLSQPTSTACASGTAITFTISNTQLQTLTLDWLGIQAAVANANLSASVGGSKVYLPSGTYQPNHPILNSNGSFEGITFAGDGTTVTQLRFPSDLGQDACGLGEVNRGSLSSNSDYRDFSLYGPIASLVLGTPPNLMDGLCIGSNAQVHSYTSSYLRAGLNTEGNHWGVYDSTINSNYYGIYFAPYPTNVGNAIINNVLTIGNTLAGIASATTNQIDSALITSSGPGFSPYGFYEEANPSTVTSPRGFITNSTFVATGAEAIGNVWIFAPYSYGSVTGNTFTGGGLLDVGGNATYKLGSAGKPAAIDVGVFNQNTMVATNWSPYTSVTTAIIVASGTCNTDLWVNDFNFVSSPSSTIQPFSCTGGASGNRFNGPNGEGTFMYSNGGAITAAYLPLTDTGGSQNKPYVRGTPYAGLSASVAGSGNIVGVITYAADLGGVLKASAAEVITGGELICPGVGGVTGCTSGAGAIGTADFTSGNGTTTVNMRLDPALTASVLPGITYSGTPGSGGSSLPTCTSAIKGLPGVVSDATSPTFLAAYTSGGAVVSPVLCNGSSWVTY